MKQIRVGIIGFGLSGRVFHAPFLHVHPGFVIRKVVERHAGISKTIYPHVEVVNDYQEVIRDPDIDLCIITTPNTLHYTMALECLEAGKHIVIEKPFTNTVAEAAALIELARAKDKKIFVYQNRRWDGDFMTIRKILGNKMLGNVFEYEAHFDRFRPVVPQGKWREEELPGGGIVYDLGSHLIDQALQLFGKPLGLYSDIRKQRPGSLVDDYFDIHLYYNGFKAILKAGMMVRNSGPRYVIHGNKGTFVKYGIDPQEAALRNGEIPGTPDWGKETPEIWGILTTDIRGLVCESKIETLQGNYMAFFDNVYDVLLRGEEIAVKPEEAMEVIRIIELASESSKEKKVIEMKY